MPTDRARQLQQNLNLWWWPEKTANLTTDGAFGPATYAALEFVRTCFAWACDWAEDYPNTNYSFFADPSIFADFADEETDDVKVTFRLRGSSDSVTLRKSLYERLSKTNLANRTPSQVSADAIAMIHGVTRSEYIVHYGDAVTMQRNINTILTLSGGRPIAVDGVFGPTSFAAYNAIRSLCAPLAEMVQRARVAANYDFLRDPSIFYDAPPNKSGFTQKQLYGTQTKVWLCDALYWMLKGDIDDFTRKFGLTPADIQALQA
jgi:lysozyme family protein